AGRADVVESYVICEIADLAPTCSPEELYTSYARQVAQILRAERAVPSDQEVRDALTHRISFSAEDVTFIDWDAALIVDRDADDVRAVLEFANVELLEMRFLDQRLDDALDESYERLSRRPYAFWQLPRSGGSGSCRSRTRSSSRASTTRSSCSAISTSRACTGWSRSASTSPSGTRASCGRSRPSRASTRRSPTRPRTGAPRCSSGSSS